MLYCLLIALILSNINCLTRLPGNVSTDYYFTAFMNEDNELIYFEPKEKSLYVFPPTLDPSEYENELKVNTSSFIENNIPSLVYLYIKYLNATSIELSFFDEEHLSVQTFEKNSSIYDHISVRPLFDRFNLYVFSNAKNSSEHRNTLQIIGVNMATKATTTRFTYRFRSEAERVNCYCTATTDNDIFCGMIEKTENSTHAFYNHTIFVIDEDDGSNMGRHLIESSYEVIDNEKGTEYLNILHNKLFILNSFGNERMFYCYINSGVFCGLAQVRRRRLEVVVEKEKIFDDFSYQSNLVSDSISFKQRGNDFILSLIDGEKVRFAKISISNNRILVNYKTEQIFMKSNSPYFAKLFLDNNDQLMIALAFKEKGEIHPYIAELEYTTCSDTNVTVYNAEKKLLTFNINYNIFDSYSKNDIFFLNDGNTINSLLYTNNEKIVESEKYDVRANIYFNLSDKDYEDIKNQSVYELQFTNSLDRDSQKCKLTINFKKCESKCEYCTEYKCWDKNWKLIYEKKEDKNKDKDADKDNDDKDNDNDNNNDKDKDNDKNNDKNNNKDPSSPDSGKDDDDDKKSNKESDNKLKGYQIALIIIGVLLVIALIVGLILFFKCRSKKQKTESNIEDEVDNEPLSS